MRRWLHKHYARFYGRSIDWLEQYPKIKRILEWTGCLDLREGPIARGAAVGIFVGLTPTVGVQTVLMIVGCALVRGNFPIAFLFSWVSNPFTAPPLYLAFRAIGDTMFNPIVRQFMQVNDTADEALLQAVFTGLGSLVVAVPCAVAGYALVRWLRE